VVTTWSTRGATDGCGGSVVVVGGGNVDVVLVDVASRCVCTSEEPAWFPEVNGCRTTTATAAAHTTTAAPAPNWRRRT
jgi:hypothetical protein